MAIIKLLSLKIICDYFKRKRPLSPAVQHCCSLPTSVHLLPILCVVLIFGIFFIFLSFSRYRCSIDPSIFFYLFIFFQVLDFFFFLLPILCYLFSCVCFSLMILLYVFHVFDFYHSLCFIFCFSPFVSFYLFFVFNFQRSVFSPFTFDCNHPGDNVFFIEKNISLLPISHLLLLKTV